MSYVATMSIRTVALGPFGALARENIVARRAELGLTAAEVADRTSRAPRPLGRSAVSELERGARRIDIDDLFAIALALEVSPIDLLRPKPTGEAITLDQRNLVLLPDQARKWLSEGGDISVHTTNGEGPEAELAKVNNELSKLRKREADRDVLISVLHKKISEAEPLESNNQIHKMLQEEIALGQVEDRQRDVLELRRAKLQSTIHKGAPDGDD